jgi:hypothetical protein
MKPNSIKYKMFKHTLLVVCGFIFVFAIFYSKFKGQSGGDIGLIMFSVIFLTICTLVIGVITYSWEFKAKFGVILGLLTSYLLAYVLFKILVY